MCWKDAKALSLHPPHPQYVCMWPFLEIGSLLMGQLKWSHWDWLEFNNPVLTKRGNQDRERHAHRRVPFENEGRNGSEDTQDGQKITRCWEACHRFPPSSQKKTTLPAPASQDSRHCFPLRPQLGLPCVAASDNKYKHPRQSFIPVSPHWDSPTSYFKIQPGSACCLSKDTGCGLPAFARLAAFATAVLFAAPPHSRQSQSPQLKYLTSHFWRLGGNKQDWEVDDTCLVTYHVLIEHLLGPQTLL